MKTKGFDKAIKGFSDHQKKVANLKEKGTLQYSELFTSDFLKSHSKITKFNDFMDYLGISTQEDYDNISNEELDKKTSEISDFKTFKDMFDKAVEIYLTHMI